MKTKSLMITLLFLLVPISGCLGNNSDTGPQFEIDADSLPESSIGVNDPIIDGVIDVPNAFYGGWDEWSDSYSYQVNGDCEESLLDLGAGIERGTLTDNACDEISYQATLHLKAVGTDVSFALEIDFESTVSSDQVRSAFEILGADGSVDRYVFVSDVGDTPDPYTMVEVPCIDSLTDCDTSEYTVVKSWGNGLIMIGNEDNMSAFSQNYNPAIDGFLPGLELIDFDNRIASTQTSNKLVLEGTKSNALAYSNIIDLEIKVRTNDGALITFDENSLNFGYAIPAWWDTIDLSISSIEVVQNVQSEDNDVNLIKGKPTLVRVFVEGDVSSEYEAEVTLRYCFITTLFCGYPVTSTSDIVTEADRNNVRHSANFFVPADWLNFDKLILKAEVSHLATSDALDLDMSNNLEYLEIDLHSTISEYVVYNIDMKDSLSNHGSSYTDWTMRANDILETFYPVESVNDLYYVDHSDCQATDGWLTSDYDLPFDWTNPLYKDRNTVCLNVLTDLWTSTQEAIYYANELDGGSDLPPIPDQVSGWLPGGGYNGKADPTWGWGDGIVSVNVWNKDALNTNFHGDTTLAHEIEHNIGPKCIDETGNLRCREIHDHSYGMHLSQTGVSNSDQCGAGGKDRVYNSVYEIDKNVDYSMNIRGVGWDPMAWSRTQNNNWYTKDYIIPDSVPEIMSYCFLYGREGYDITSSTYWPVISDQISDFDTVYDAWISDYRVNKLFQKFSDYESGEPYSPHGRSASDLDSRTVRIVHIGISDEFNLTYLSSHLTTGITNLEVTGQNDVEEYGDELCHHTNTHEDYNSTQLECENLGHIWMGPEEINLIVVSLKDSNGKEIKSLELTPQFEDSEHRVLTEAFHTLRFQDDGQIHRIDVFNSDDELLGTISSQNNLDEIRFNELSTKEIGRGDSVNLSWKSPDVKDLKFSVTYSTGNGIWYPLTGWINQTYANVNLTNFPKSDNGYFRVQVNDGFSSVFSHSDAFMLENQASILELDIHTSNSRIAGIEEIDPDSDYPNVRIQQHEIISIIPKISVYDWEAVVPENCMLRIYGDRTLSLTLNKIQRSGLN